MSAVSDMSDDTLVGSTSGGEINQDYVVGGLDSNSAYVPHLRHLSSEAASLLSSLINYYPLSLSLHDYDRTSYYTRRLSNYVSLLYPLSEEQRIFFINLLIDALINHELEIYIQIKIITTLTQLLKKRKNDLPDSFTVEWHRFYESMMKYQLVSSRLFTTTASQLRSRSTAFTNLLLAARRYFTLSSVKEIWTTFSPLTGLADHSASTRSFALLSLLLPSHHKEILTIIPPLLQAESYYDQSPASVLPFYALYARVAKHQLNHLSEEQLLPVERLFNSYVQLLNLDVGGESSVHSSRSGCPNSYLVPGITNSIESISKHIAKIIVYTLHNTNKHTSSLPLLAQFFSTVSTYLHPTNNGKWSNGLAAFLSNLSIQYAKRLGRERRKVAKYDSRYNIVSNDFVQVLLPVALGALFNKSSVLVSAAEKTIRHLAYFHPSLVLPRYLPYTYSALEDLSSPHRMLSVMQSFSQIAPILFNRRLYPQGASHLESLLTASLPGVDSMDLHKTSLTLTWFTVIFYNIPFFDAKVIKQKKISQKKRNDESYTKVKELPTNIYSDNEVISFNQNSTVSMSIDDQESFGESGDVDDDEDDEDDARTVTMKLEEWSLSFLSSLFHLLSSADKFAKKDYLDVHAARLLSKCLKAFFSCLSIEIYTSVINKLTQHILSNYQPHAMKQWGIFLTNASAAQPQILLPKLFDQIYYRLINKTNETLTNLSNSEIEWNVYLLAQIVKQSGGGGQTVNILIPYVKKIEVLFLLLSNHDSKVVRKVNNKLLRNTLSALTSTYPSEWHPFDTRQWTDQEVWKSWNVWSNYEPVFEDDNKVVDPLIEWHVPTEDEMKAAGALLTNSLSPAIKLLTSYIQGQSNLDSNSDTKQGKGDGLIEQSMSSLINGVRGVQSVAGYFTGEEIESVGEGEINKNENSLFSRCPFLSIHHTNTLSALSSSLFDSVPPLVNRSLRDYFLSFSNQLTSHILSSMTTPNPSSSTPSLKSLSLCVKLLSSVLTLYSQNESKLQSEMYMSGFARNWMREYESGYKTKLRPLLIQRAYDYHLNRVTEASYSAPYTQQVQTSIQLLNSLSTNDFSKLRGKASKLLVSLLHRYSQGIDPTIVAMNNILSSESSSEESLIGALTLLSDSSVRTWITRKWNRLSLILNTICKDTEKHKDDKVQILIQSFFTQIYSSLFPINTKIEHIQHSNQQQQELRNSVIDRINNRVSNLYLSLIKSLLTYSTNSSLHWRYQLMSAAFLYVLIRGDDIPIDLYSSITVSFTKMLSNELSPMRTVAITAVNRILSSHNKAIQIKLSNSLNNVGNKSNRNSNLLVNKFDSSSPSSSTTIDGSITAVTSINEEKDWLNTRFYDYLYSGWRDEETAISTRYQLGDDDRYIVIQNKSPYTYKLTQTPVLLPAECLSQILSLLKENLSFFVDALTHHHPSLAPSNEGSNSNNQSTGAGETISGLAYSHFPSLSSSSSSSPWPYTHIQVASKAFDHTHVSLIRAIIECFPSFANMNNNNVDSNDNSWLEKELRRLASKTHEQDSQCTAAEIIAGVVKSTYHLTLSNQRRIQDSILPAIINCCNLVPPDSVPHFMASFRYIYTNTDPRRLAWLTRYFISSALHTLPPNLNPPSDTLIVDPSSSQYKRFRFILPCLIEEGYRTRSLCEWLLSALSAGGWLNHKYKQVRTEIGWILYLSWENIFNIKNPIIMKQEFIHPSQPIINWLTNSVNHLNSLAPTLYKSNKESAINNAMRIENDNVKSIINEESGVDVKSVDLAQHYLETILNGAALAFHSGSLLSLSPVYLTYLPHILSSQHIADQETANMAKQVAKIASWVIIKGVDIKRISSANDIFDPSVILLLSHDGELSDRSTLDVISSIIQLMNSLLSSSLSTWHVRVSVLKYLQITLTRHSQLLNNDQINELNLIIVQRLTDSQLEVRIAASNAFLAFINSIVIHPNQAKNGFNSTHHTSQNLKNIIKSLTKLSRKPRGSPERHGGVLGLLSIIRAHPYEVPPHIPPLLEYCISYSSEGGAIEKDVKIVVREFLRSHKEEWERFKAKFNEQQLDAIYSVQAAPTYFA